MKNQVIDCTDNPERLKRVLEFFGIEGVYTEEDAKRKPFVGVIGDELGLFTALEVVMTDAEVLSHFPAIESDAPKYWLYDDKPEEAIYTHLLGVNPNKSKMFTGYTLKGLEAYKTGNKDAAASLIADFKNISIQKP